MDTTSLFTSMILGAIGTGYFIYGKKQQRPIPLFCGLGLMGFPYFVSNVPMQLGIGILLILLPYLIGKFTQF